MENIFHWLLSVLLVTCLAGQIFNGAKAQSFDPNNIVDNLKDNDLLQDIHVNSNEILSETRELGYSLLLRESMHKILNQMPCGWPEFGIPPLAPYQNEKWEFIRLNNFTDIQTSVQQLRIDGLNDLDIDKLVVSYTFNKFVKFDFNYRNITAIGKFKTNTALNLSEIIGLKFNASASGNLNLSLEDLRFTGSFKYKLPILLGSAEIYDFRVKMSLGNVHSQLNGIVNGLPITDVINRSIENMLLKAVNNNQIFFSSMLEQLMLPKINSQLQGKKLWNVIMWSMKLYEMDECLTKESNYAGDAIISNEI